MPLLDKHGKVRRFFPDLADSPDVCAPACVRARWIKDSSSVHDKTWLLICYRCDAIHAVEDFDAAPRSPVNLLGDLL